MLSRLQGQRTRRVSRCRVPKLRPIPARRRPLRHHQTVGSSSVYANAVCSAVSFPASHIDTHIIASGLSQHHSAGNGSRASLIPQGISCAHLAEISVSVSQIQTSVNAILRLCLQEGILYRPGVWIWTRIRLLSAVLYLRKHKLIYVTPGRRPGGQGYCYITGLQGHTLRYHGFRQRHTGVQAACFHIYIIVCAVQAKHRRPGIAALPCYAAGNLIISRLRHMKRIGKGIIPDQAKHCPVTGSIREKSCSSQRKIIIGRRSTHRRYGQLRHCRIRRGLAEFDPVIVAPGRIGGDFKGMLSRLQGQRTCRISCCRIPKLRPIPARRRPLRHHQTVGSSSVYANAVCSAVSFPASHIDTHIIASGLSQHHSAADGSRASLVPQGKSAADLGKVSISAS